MNRTILALAALLGLCATAAAQVPPPVPALPDSERRTAYSISSSTCACSVGFALYEDSTDVDQQIQVWINGVQFLSTDLTHGWGLTSATGPLASIPRPITDAVLTFTAVQTGTVQIVGAQRPRRLSQFAENRGVAARDLNQVLTYLTSTERERWDALVRSLRGLPGETISPLPAAASRANGILGFDATGLIPTIFSPNLGLGTVIGPNSSVDGHVAVFSGTNGQVIRDGGPAVGTVSSVGLSLPNIFTVTGSPVTTAGTLTGTLATETANFVFAGPTSGSAATPNFRALVLGDLPFSSNGALPYSNGSAMTFLAPTATANQMLMSGASSAPAWSTSTWPTTVSQGDLLFGSASNVWSTLTKNIVGTRYLANTGSSNAPNWDQVNLVNGVTNILPLANGGTSSNLTAANGAIPYSGASQMALLAPTATGGLPMVSGANAAPSWGAAYRGRLTANQNYYVNGNSGGTATCGSAGSSTCAAGSDSNDCLTPATACLTLQHVTNLLTASVDIGNNTVQIFLAHNAGTANYQNSCVGGGWLGTSVIFVIGDSAAPTATVIVDPNGSYGLQIKDGCTLEYDFVQFNDSGSTNASGHILVGASGNSGHLDFKGVTFNTLAIGTHLTVGYLGSATATGSNTIAGGANFALAATDGGTIDFGAQTVTVSGTPAWTTGFAFLKNGGTVEATASTFSGSATGSRCQINGPINTGLGLNPNKVFPGNVDCVPVSYVGAVNVPTGAGGSSSYSAGSAGQPYISGGTGQPSYGTLGIGGGGTGVASGAVAFWTSPTVNVNLNSAADTSISVPLPSGYTRITGVQVHISGASGNISTGTFGLFTATGGGGAAIVSAATAFTVTTSADNTNNNLQIVNQNNNGTGSWLPISNTIFFRVGSTVNQTANIQVYYRPIP